ncbi:MAG TPA: AzlC family ABC transporter permease [Acidimicrobiales bacterium]|nr:AzlC family ABC transporter permease [Acidimicrobiales bacterium]
MAIGVATGAYGLSFGALGTAAHLSVAQTCVLSLLLFSGASEFAYVGSVTHPIAATVSALLLGLRNGLYSLRNRPVLCVRGPRRLLAAHLTIDETTAMVAAQAEVRLARFAFWSTGVSLYVLWNLATFLGALGAAHLGSPQRFGLDAAEPAAFLALLAPRLVDRRSRAVALAGAAVALALAPVSPAGVPILAAACVAGAAGAAVRPRPRLDRPDEGDGLTSRPGPAASAPRPPTPDVPRLGPTDLRGADERRGR